MDDSSEVVNSIQNRETVRHSRMSHVAMEIRASLDSMETLIARLVSDTFRQHTDWTCRTMSVEGECKEKAIGSSRELAGTTREIVYASPRLFIYSKNLLAFQSLFDLNSSNVVR